MHAPTHPAIAFASVALWGLPALGGWAAWMELCPCPDAAGASIVAALVLGMAAAVAPTPHPA